MAISCASQPTRIAPEIETAGAATSYGTVSIVGCEDYQKKNSLVLDCDARSNELSEELKSLHLFSQVIIGREKATDYFIRLKPYDRYPYYSRIGHNPGIFILSIIIPFWQTSTYGYDFEIFSKHSKVNIRINTLYEGTDILWSGSLLINLSSKRGIPRSHSMAEKAYLKNTIINALTAKTFNK